MVADNDHLTTLLCDAVVFNDTNRLRRLLSDTGVDPNRVEVNLAPFPRPLVHLCCQQNRFQIVKVFFENSTVDVEKRDRFGNTLLHCAVCTGNALDLVRFLVETAQCNTNARNSGLRTPLHTLCWSNIRCLDMVRYLVEHGEADVNAKDCDGWTPLVSACANADNDTVIYLAQRAQIDTKVFKAAWRYGCSWTSKQTLVENFARRGLHLPNAYISSFSLQVALRTPLPYDQAFLDFIDNTPSTAKCTLDTNGQLPLHVALSSSTGGTNACVVLQLLKLEPRSGSVRDFVSGLYPFEAAAIRTYPDDENDNNNTKELELVYRLFRHNPQKFLATRVTGLGARVMPSLAHQLGRAKRQKLCPTNHD